MLKDLACLIITKNVSIVLMNKEFCLILSVNTYFEPNRLKLQLVFTFITKAAKIKWLLISKTAA